MGEILGSIADIDWVMVVKIIGLMLLILFIVLLLSGFFYDIGLPVPDALGHLAHRILHGPYPF